MIFKKTKLVSLLFSTALLPLTLTSCQKMQSEAKNEASEGQMVIEEIETETKAEDVQGLAEQGDAEAQFDLGWMYDIGEGVHQDYAKAAQWYMKSANQGFPEAQYNLGVMYREGEGVPQNYAEAIKWYTKAANQGFPEAEYNLGLMYTQGMA